MNKEIRWRIISLQAMLVIILMGASGFLFYEGSFVTNMVKDELTAQQVFFPTADQIKTGGALDPAEFPQEIRDQAGNQVTDGNQARIYANDFLGKHLQGVAGGLTYASIGGKTNPQQPELMRAAIARMASDSEIVAAMDADLAGRELVEIVRRAVELSGRLDLKFTVHVPVGHKDWNDQLRAKPHPLLPYRPEVPSVA